MSNLEVCSLNSGSNGNAYYISNGKYAILIDLGISCRMVEQRLKEIGKSPFDISAILISHEHADHVRGIKTFQKKYQTKVYIRPAVYQKFKHKLINIEFFEENPFSIFDFTIFPFRKYHDAIDPCSFLIQYENFNIGVITDIGRVCNNVIDAVKNAQLLFLESNYDEYLLENGKYPTYLKNRIRGGYGHISNKEALDLVNSFGNPNLEKVFLSHLSKENNSPEICLRTFKNLKNKDINLEIAPRDGISSVWKYKSKRIWEDVTTDNFVQSELFD